MGVRHYAIIGGGAAGSYAAFRIRDKDDSAKITVLNEEPVPFYHRYDLPRYLSGRITKEKLFLMICYGA